jgi:UDP-3-O-[3-hydroxymyristoyl] glucosamine N-acyltransferase
VIVSDPAPTFPDTDIASTAIIGNPFRPLLDGREVTIDRPTTIGKGVSIGHYTIVGQGARIGADSIIEEFVNIQPQCEIGSHVLVTSRSYIGMGATVGDDCVIKGHVGENSRVGARCRIFGDLIHSQRDPTIPWDDPTAEEPDPVVEEGAFVGWRATVVGGVKIGVGAYICAGAVITKDVPPGHIARGLNQIMHPDSWRGALGKSPFFRQHRIPQATPVSSRPRRLGAMRPWSPWSHPDGSVEPDRLPVKHGVLDDVGREGRVLGGLAEPGGVRNLVTQRLSGLLGQSRK